MHYLETVVKNSRWWLPNRKFIILASTQANKKLRRVFRVIKLNDAIKRLDVEAKVKHMIIKCCIPSSKLHAW
jgi:hypothetical protein